MKRYLAALTSAGLVGLACINTAEPRGFVFQYEIAVYDCGTSCGAPGPIAISSAARGDTVWLWNAVTLTGAVDSFTPQAARLRPDCAENVIVISGISTVRSVPTPATCPDSTYLQSFTLAGIDYPTAIERYHQWVVDSGLAVGTYGIRGRVMVQPRVEPTFLFEVQ